ncbi:MAG: SET domain-containing protein-lysine N-methyltransferase [Bacteroidetes bacterium]|nr:SET domain-containing protein-lysine N-methyltransferase [Bacteroidota bacterium]
MLLVETFIDCTRHKGVGLFAKEFIKQGTIYWVRNESFDRLFTEETLSNLDPFAIRYIEKYGFLETSGNWYLCNDNARFSNHSDNPNSDNHLDEFGVVQYCTASRDINKGDEILCDYTKVCQTCKNGVDFESLS